MRKVWNLFKGFWSFNIEARVGRRDFWITFLMMLVFSIGLCIGGYHSLVWLNEKIGIIDTGLGLTALFGLIFGCYLLGLWISLIIFIARRLRDIGLKSYWYYIVVLAELTPLFMVIFSDTSKSEIPSLFLVILLYMFPMSYFQLPMLFPFLLCLLPSKPKD